MSNFSKLIDNERISLLTIFKAICEKEVKELAIATGYWDLAGTMLLLNELERFDNIRLLIGRELSIARNNLKNIETDFPYTDIAQLLQDQKVSDETRTAVRRIANLIGTKTLRVKIYKKDFLHAKCYIFGKEGLNQAYGIIGSSNFTKKGMQDNLELNYLEDNHQNVLFKPQSDIQTHGHLSWFNQLWHDPHTQEWTGKFSQIINTSNHGFKLYSPKDMYWKVLEELYGEELDQIPENSNDTAHDNGLLKFQKRNVERIVHILRQNQTAILADSVGLGKTKSAIGVMRHYRQKRIIVIAPKSLEQHWKNELFKENISEATIISMSTREEKLEKEEMRWDDKFPVSLFVIDESHNLRSHASKRYELLSKWIEKQSNSHAHVLFLTATPINNSLNDLINQILLGTRGNQSLPLYITKDDGTVTQSYFYDAVKFINNRIKSESKKGNSIDEIIRECKDIIDPLLRKFVIRNTRQSIAKDLQGKPLLIDGKEFHFPKTTVKNMKYPTPPYNQNLESNISEIECRSIEEIGETMNIILHPLRQFRDAPPVQQNTNTLEHSSVYQVYQYILALSFVPYRYAMYYKKFYGKNREELKRLESSDELKKMNSQLGIYGILRTVFLKRFESSAEAIERSILNYRKRLLFFKEQVNHGYLVDVGDLDNIEKLVKSSEFDDASDIFQLSEEELRNKYQKEISKTEISSDMHINNLLDDVKNETEILQSIEEQLQAIKNSDTKFNLFKEIISSILKSQPKTKILVFSFYKDTIEFLKKRLASDAPVSFDYSLAEFVSGGDSNINEIADRFSPHSRNYDINDNELQFLFSTDVLSEGQNLQDCHILINYDLHWNPVRMIQRNGRINRIGSKKDILIYNIIPNQDLENILKLVKVLSEKIAIINATIGSDATILGEEINPVEFQGIYDQNEQTASDAYTELELISDKWFSEDSFIHDLMDFRAQSTEEDKIRIRNIPRGKWGILHNPQPSASEIVIMAKVVPSNNGKQSHSYEFFHNTREIGNMGYLRKGIALLQIKSMHDQEPMDRLTVDKQSHFNDIKEKGKYIIGLDSSESKPLSNRQRNIINFASNNNYPNDKINQLYQLFSTNNVSLGRKVKKYVNAMHSNLSMQALEQLLSLETDNNVNNQNITGIEPFFGFSRENR